VTTPITAFERWLDVFIEEKGIDTEHLLEVVGPSGTNWIPVECLLDAIKAAPPHEQEAIKTMIVKIDFVNGNVLDYFEHLAQAIAL
jgi:hypothetical protein